MKKFVLGLECLLRTYLLHESSSVEISDLRLTGSVAVIVNNSLKVAKSMNQYLARISFETQ